MNADTRTAVTVAAVGAGALVLWNYLKPAADDPGDFDQWDVDGEPTLPAYQLQMMASVIHAAFWEFWIFGEDEDDISRTILACNTNADLAALANTYGRRQGPIWGDASLNLPELVIAGMDDDEVQALNAALLAKGITIQF